MSLVIGIDIGGTNIKAALHDATSGECVARHTAPTSDGQFVSGAPAWAESVRELIAQFEKESSQKELRIGISAPGLAARDGSRIEFMPGRMAGLAGFDWRDFLKRQTFVLNDAHAALIGEIWCGATKAASDVVMLTLGTGVGGAVVSEGRLLRGHLGRAGHFGHISLDPHGVPDIVNTPGSLEDAIGNATIERRSEGRFTMTSNLIAAVQSGSREAVSIWDESMRALAAGIVSLVNCFDPECVLLGGGVAAGAGETLTRPLASWLDKFEWRPAGDRVRIELATLGEWAGACGAAWHVLSPDHLPR